MFEGIYYKSMKFEELKKIQGSEYENLTLIKQRVDKKKSIWKSVISELTTQNLSTKIIHPKLNLLKLKPTSFEKKSGNSNDVKLASYLTSNTSALELKIVLYTTKQ